MTAQVVSMAHPPAGELPFELVERKGIGHPDTLCDAIAERASLYYSRHCLAEHGRIAHHWFDKVMLIGGESRLEPGHGELVSPYRIIFAGKAAKRVGSQQIPLEEILHRAARDVLDEVLTGFDPDRHMRLDVRVVDAHGAGRRDSRYRPRDTSDLARLDEPRRVSNDCNLLSAFAPLSRLETMVLRLEHHLNSPAYKKRNPGTGSDVKILGIRREAHTRLVVNIPFLASHVSSSDDYWDHKQALERDIAAFLKETLDAGPELLVNATDRNGRPYLVALGSVADTGDVGVVGRGNRMNGLITPMRPMSIEAPAGKNPVDHTGKLYGLLAQDIADDIAARANRDTEVFVFASKEAPLESPDEIVVALDDWRNDQAQGPIEDCIASHVAAIPRMTEQIITQGRTMW